MRRAVLMGDPTHFNVKGGANPHTRTRFGRRRRVDVPLAIRQWTHLRDTLRELGVRVVVIPPSPDQPGLVYPANAGFQLPLDAEVSPTKKTFYLANLLPTRAGEKPHYRSALGQAGFRVGTIDDRYRFEGEADFFAVANHYVLTTGTIEQQRFVPTLGVPPWKRVYGFRTDERVEPILRELVAPAPILHVELCLEAHYHGDTAFCAFGPDRRHLLLYPKALTPESLEAVRATFGDRILELSDEDAARYAANSFSLNTDDESILVMPEGVSDELLDDIRMRKVTTVTVDVSEFLKKGGGSVKCMIGDLGPVPDEMTLASHG